MLSASPRRGIIRSRAVGAALAVGTAVLLAACSSGSGSSSAGYRGDTLSRPVVLTAAARTTQFQSTASGRTTLGALQQGKLMLVYFGYTHCPDVCPTILADLGEALRQLSPKLQARTQVVFITADPDRDTPAVMKTWLDNFDPHLATPFVGLTSSVSHIDAVATSVGIPLQPPVKHNDGSITVDHGAQTLAFAKDRASLLWTYGTTVGD